MMVGIVLVMGRKRGRGGGRRRHVSRACRRARPGVETLFPRGSRDGLGRRAGEGRLAGALGECLGGREQIFTRSGSLASVEALTAVIASQPAGRGQWGVGAHSSGVRAGDHGAHGAVGGLSGCSGSARGRMGRGGHARDGGRW